MNKKAIYGIVGSVIGLLFISLLWVIVELMCLWTNFCAEYGLSVVVVMLPIIVPVVIICGWIGYRLSEV